MAAAQMKASRNRLIDVLILLAIALVGVVTWKLQPKSDKAVALSACDLNQRACSADLPDGGRIELAIEPRPIPALRPLKLQLTLSGVEADKVEVDFAGVSMNMGYNRPRLTPTAARRHEGHAVLPVCVSGSMEWQATVLIETGQKVISVPFRFQSGEGS